MSDPLHAPRPVVSGTPCDVVRLSLAGHRGLLGHAVVTVALVVALAAMIALVLT